MAQRLTPSFVKALKAPPEGKGSRIVFDDLVPGFGVRVTEKGTKSFMLDYRNRAGHQRRYTIGTLPAWEVGPAREEAKRLRRKIDVGEDPQEESKTEREAKTVQDLIDRFRDEHLPKKRASTVTNYELVIDKYIKPALKNRKVADVKYTDVEDLKRKVGKSYQANRTLAVLSKMMSLAVKWQWRADNPVRGVDRLTERRRATYLEGEELGRLLAALAVHKDKQSANIIRLLLLTGARRGEVLGARWEQFDLTAGRWTKPPASTKQDKMHEVPLSAPARLLLAELWEDADDDAEFVFPSATSESGHVQEIKKSWAKLCKAAGITGVRVHDLRHTYASALASTGHSLPVIGELLGHTQPSTTQRYSHLFEDAKRKAAEKAAEFLTGAKQRSKRRAKDGDNIHQLKTSR
jgi:integrase